MKEEAMFYQVVRQCVQMLKNLETCLDKAEQYAAAKKFDVGILIISCVNGSLENKSTKQDYKNLEHRTLLAFPFCLTPELSGCRRNA